MNQRGLCQTAAIASCNDDAYLCKVLYALKSEQSSEMSEMSAHLARNEKVSKIQEVQYVQYLSGSAVALGHVHLIVLAGERKRPFCSPAYSLATNSLADGKMR